MNEKPNAPHHHVARHAEPGIREALTDSRIVAIVGPRQSGKTTLARRIARGTGFPFLTLDDNQSLYFAREDPSGFLRGQRIAVIDEVQRAPGLILALKKAVDEDTRPGRYLITGSVDLFRGAISPDSLAGRVETIRLLPFSQSEIEGTGRPRFLDKAFSASFPSQLVTGRSSDLVERAVCGGFPEALSRPVSSRRIRWFLAYVEALALRDASEIATIRDTGRMRRLIDHAAAAGGQLLNSSRLGANLGVDSKSVDRWVTLLEHMFLVCRVPAWHRNELKRLVRAPRLHFLDSGLLAALLRVDARSVARERTRLGPLLECFVFGELLKQTALDEDVTAISHYRDKDQVEVDFVLERHGGRVVGVEVKASASVAPGDFRGLSRLRAAAGAGFACGIVLHDGDRVQQLADGMFAMPLRMLWEA